MTEPRQETETRAEHEGVVPRGASALDLRQFFDTIAEEYSAKYHEDSLWGHVLRERKRRLIELLDGTAPGKMLDVGCGPGAMAPDFLDLGYEFFGIDSSPRMIEESRRLFGADPRARFEVMDAQDLRFASEFFDGVMSIGVIERVPHPERAIMEMARVLRPNGLLLVSFPNLLSPYAAWRNYVFYAGIGVLKNVGAAAAGKDRVPDICSAARLRTPKSARRMVERLVGPVHATAYYNFGVLLSPLDRVFPRAANGAVKFLERVHSGPFRWLGAGFVMAAKKRA